MPERWHEKIQRHALGGEDAARRSVRSWRSHRPARRRLPSPALDGRSSMRGSISRNASSGEVEPGDDARLARHQARVRGGVRRHDGVGGDVAGAAEILQQRGAHQGSIMIGGRGKTLIAVRRSRTVGSAGCAAAAVASARRSVRRVRTAPARPGKSVRAWPPRLSFRRAAATHHQAERRRIGGRPARSRQRRQRAAAARRPVASRSTPAWRDRIGRTGAGVGRRRQAARGERRAPGRRRRGDVARPPSGAGHGGFQQRVAGQAVGAVQAGAGRLAAGPQPVDAMLRPARVHGDAAHVVMRRRAHRNRLRRRVDAGRAAGGGDGGEAARRNRRRAPARASRKTRWPAGRWRQTARATTSRGSSSAPGWPAMKRAPVSSIRMAPSPRTASLTSGIGSVPASSAVGWNCTNSRSASAAPARAASSQPLADGRRRVGGVQVQPADAAGGQHHAAGRQQQRAVRTGDQHAAQPRRPRRPAGAPRRAPGW